MGLASVVAVIAIFLAAVILYIRKKQDEKKERLIMEREEYMEEVVIHPCGKDHVFLKRIEIPHFDVLDRAQKREVIKQFQKAVKKGKYIPIYENKELIGYESK
jgi:hypothetical protein